jgi:hypothetical protein
VRLGLRVGDDWKKETVVNAITVMDDDAYDVNDFLLSMTSCAVYDFLAL